MTTFWTVLGIAAGTGLAAVGGWLLRKLIKIMGRTSDFLDDWAGQPGREGVPRRPGVMERLAAVEKIAGQVLAETRPNGGHSLRDVLHRTRSDVADMRSELAQLTAWRAQIEQQVTTTRTRITARPRRADEQESPT